VILVSIQQAHDVRLAKALLRALGDCFEFFLLFGSEALKREFGQPPSRYGVDALVCLLNAHNFELAVSFSGACDTRSLENVLLLSFFNEVGIATLEIQHELFQQGLEGQALGARAAAHSDAEHGLRLAYAANSLLEWSGDDGIGYLASELPVEPLSLRGPFVLITSHRDHPARARYQLAIAMLELAAKHPELQFVWRPDHGEGEDPQASAALSMLDDYAVSNLRVERRLPTESLIAACQVGITTVTSRLVDFQLHDKAVLVHVSERDASLAEMLCIPTFARAAELPAAFGQLLASPELHRVDTGVGRLDVGRLEARLRTAVGSTVLAAAWLPVALRYLPEFRTLRNRGSDLDLQQLSEELARAIERIGVLQRSTLAYKAKKLALRLRRGWSRE
jgi:hypothetical protein